MNLFLLLALLSVLIALSGSHVVNATNAQVEPAASSLQDVVTSSIRHLLDHHGKPNQVLFVFRAPQWPCRVNPDTAGVCQEFSPAGLCRTENLAIFAPELMDWHEGDAPIIAVADRNRPCHESWETGMCHTSLQTMEPLATRMGLNVLTEWYSPWQDNWGHYLELSLKNGVFNHQNVVVAWHLKAVLMNTVRRLRCSVNEQGEGVDWGVKFGADNAY
jgi:hypothetical protein